MGKGSQRRKINNGVHPRQTDAEMPWDNEDDKQVGVYPPGSVFEGETCSKALNISIIQPQLVVESMDTDRIDQWKN